MPIIRIIPYLCDIRYLSLYIDDYRVCIPNSHLYRVTNTRCRIGTVFSWWWSHSCPKHVEKSNKHIKKKLCTSWLYLQVQRELIIFDKLQCGDIMHFYIKDFVELNGIIKWFFLEWCVIHKLTSLLCRRQMAIHKTHDWNFGKGDIRKMVLKFYVNLFVIINYISRI